MTRGTGETKRSLERGSVWFSGRKEGLWDAEESGDPRGSTSTGPGRFQCGIRGALLQLRHRHRVHLDAVVIRPQAHPSHRIDTVRIFRFDDKLAVVEDLELIAARLDSYGDPLAYGRADVDLPEDLVAVPVAVEAAEHENVGCERQAVTLPQRYGADEKARVAPVAVLEHFELRVEGVVRPPGIACERVAEPDGSEDQGAVFHAEVLGFAVRRGIEEPAGKVAREIVVEQHFRGHGRHGEGCGQHEHGSKGPTDYTMYLRHVTRFLISWISCSSTRWGKGTSGLGTLC